MSGSPVKYDSHSPVSQHADREFAYSRCLNGRHAPTVQSPRSQRNLSLYLPRVKPVVASRAVVASDDESPPPFRLAPEFLSAESADVPVDGGRVISSSIASPISDSSSLSSPQSLLFRFQKMTILVNAKSY